METTDQVKRAIVIVLRQNNQYKKVLKILFSKQRGDFYLSFPYFKSQSWNAGFLTIPDNVDQIQLKPKVEGKASVIPLKLSYHHDGQTHFKQTDNSKNNVPLSYKLVQTKTFPIAELSGQHVFTIQFEGMEMFEEFSGKVANGVKTAIGNITTDMKMVKLVGYAGFTLEEVSNKYGNSIKPFIVITMRRPIYPRPLIIAMYLGEGNSIQKTGENKPYFLCLSGFRVNLQSIRGKIEGIYIHGE